MGEAYPSRRFGWTLAFALFGGFWLVFWLGVQMFLVAVVDGEEVCMFSTGTECCYSPWKL